jgi:hydrogenase expression/formation protein HypC
MCLAVPARVKEIKGTSARVDFGGVLREISLQLLGGVKKGDYVLVHSGFAISKVKKQEAEDTLKIVKELQEVMEAESASHGGRTKN